MVTLRIHFAEIIQYLAYGNSSWKSTRPRLWPKTWNTAPVGHICTHLHMQMNLTVQLLAYNPPCGDAKGRYGSFHLWTETVWSIINTCHTWAPWRRVTHDRLVYKCTVYLLGVLQSLPSLLVSLRTVFTGYHSDQTLSAIYLQFFSLILSWLIDWVKVLHPTQHKIGHFRDVP